MINFTNAVDYDKFKAIAGMSLGVFSLSVLVPLTHLIASIAIPIILNPKANITAAKMLALVGCGYLAYEIIVFSRIVIMKALSILFGPNEYTPRSFYGYKFEWLQPEGGHPLPIITTYVNHHGDVILSYTYPLSDIEEKIRKDIEDLKKQGYKIEEIV